MLNNTHNHRRFGHVLLVCGTFLLLIGGLIVTPLSSGISKAFGVSDIITLSNQVRAQLNKPDLKSNSRLMNGAQMKAEDMAKQHYFAHTSPGGTVAWDYFKKSNYNYSTAGENLAITNEDAQAVIDGWLNSPTHRDNLLSGDFKDFGIGMAYFGDFEGHKNTYVIVAFYGANSANQNITAPTSPAGTTAALKPRFLNISPTLIAITASLLIVAGVILELRHYRHMHGQGFLV